MVTGTINPRRRATWARCAHPYIVHFHNGHWVWRGSEAEEAPSEGAVCEEGAGEAHGTSFVALESVLSSADIYHSRREESHGPCKAESLVKQW